MSGTGSPRDPARNGGGASPAAGRGRERLLGALGRVAEAAGAVGLVLVFFLVFLGVLFLAMPRGIGLGKIARYERLAADSRPFVDAGEGVWRSAVALLSAVRRDVRSRPSGAVVWGAATPGTRLGDRDAVQTYDRSGAVIAFGGGNELRIGEHSMVVVRKAEENPGTGARRASIVLARGTMEGSVSDADGSTVLEVVSGGASARLSPSGDSSAEFRVTAARDDSSTFAVFRGRGEITAAGRTVVLTADQAVTVDASGRFGEPASLPSAPRPEAPAEGASARCRSLPAEVSFSWSALPGATGYRLVVARDALFGDLAVDARLDAPEFVHGNLAAGRYWWRVSALEGDAEGRGSEPRALEVVHDPVPPPLVVALPAAPVGEGVLVVRGSTEPGATVFVGDAPAAVAPSGDFEGRIALRPGPNVVVVEAMDAAGNVTYRSAVVLALP